MSEGRKKIRETLRRRLRFRSNLEIGRTSDDRPVEFNEDARRSLAYSSESSDDEELTHVTARRDFSFNDIAQRLLPAVMPDRRRRIRALSHSLISEEGEPLDSGDDGRNPENTFTIVTALST